MEILNRIESWGDGFVMIYTKLCGTMRVEAWLDSSIIEMANVLVARDFLLNHSDPFEEE